MAVGGAKADGAPCYVEPDLRINGNEVFQLSTLLSAMGVTLEHPQVDGSEGEMSFSQKAFELGRGSSDAVSCVFLGVLLGFYVDVSSHSLAFTIAVTSL